MAQQGLEGPGGNPFLNAIHGGGVPEHMRGDRLGDIGPVGRPFHDALDRAFVNADGIVHGEMMLQECADAGGHRNDPALAGFPVRAALAVDHQPPFLPLDILGGEGGKLREPKPRIQERPDHQLLPDRLTGGGYLIHLRISEGFAFVLIGHKAVPPRGACRGPLVVLSLGSRPLVVFPSSVGPQDKGLQVENQGAWRLVGEKTTAGARRDISNGFSLSHRRPGSFCTGDHSCFKRHNKMVGSGGTIYSQPADNLNLYILPCVRMMTL